MFKDTRGLEMTSSSHEAVDPYGSAIDDFLASGRGAAVVRKRVNADDPQPSIGTSGPGYFLRLLRQPPLC